MSNLKIGEDQYIGKQELNRLSSFLDENGYRKIFRRFVNTYGIVFDNVYPEALKVVSGSLSNTVTIKPGVILDWNMNMATLESQFTDALTIPADGALYRIYAQHKYTNAEKGVVSIDATGVVTGVGTKFTEVLRGQPANAVKIRFVNSSNNLLDYEVLSVDSDTQCVIQASSFTPESNLLYGVVGTFSPGLPISPDSKMIYNYDSIEFAVSASPLPQPWYALADVKITLGVMTIEDKREINKLTLILDPSIRQMGGLAFLGTTQTFAKTQTFTQGSETLLLNKKVIIGDSGNSFVVGMNDTQFHFLEDKPLGTEINLLFLNVNYSEATIVNDSTVTLPDGYKKIRTYGGTNLMKVKAYDHIRLRRVKFLHAQSTAAAFDGWIVVQHSDTFGSSLTALSSINTINTRLKTIEDNYVGNAMLDPINAALSNIAQHMLLVSALLKPFTDLGSMVFWNKPANEIPTGWREVTAWRGRMPAGFNPDDTTGYFNLMGKTGGNVSYQLSMYNIPAHTHSQFGVNSGNTGTGGQGAGNGTSQTGSAGSSNPTPIPLMNPYKVVMFIEWVGLDTNAQPPANKPSVFTLSVTEITTTNAIFNGKLSASGGALVSEKGFVYSESPTPDVDSGTKIVVSGSTIGNYTETATNLSPSTTYYVRAFATNSAGTSYGNDVSFITGDEIIIIE